MAKDPKKSDEQAKVRNSTLKNKGGDKLKEVASSGYKPRLQSLYEGTICDALVKEFSYKNRMMVPRIAKVVLNMGIGEAVKDTKKVRSARDDLTAIAGQHALITKAKNSVASFRVREGMPLGTKVTLRRHRMYEFHRSPLMAMVILLLV